MSRLFRVFVTGTDTGVGKTQVSCALLSLLADAGQRPAAMKPYESGCDDLRRPSDALALKAAARSDDPLDDICPHRFRLPLAPGVAAARLKQNPPFTKTRAAFRKFARRPLVVEGAGGLLVPVDDKRGIIDVIEAFQLPVVLVARAGLGTLNHTGLSLELLKLRHVPVRAVVLTRTSPQSDSSEKDNATWIQRRHHVEVLGPVPWEPDPQRRHEAFRKTLRPLIHEH
ncbi:MAG: dethiobiotin synthase [Myxococcaceae bacterium]|nr:dethiobiotin synthase [Myxococcaceae bacterium]